MTVAQALQASLTLGLSRLDAQGLLLHVLGKAPTERGWLLAHGDDHLTDAAAEAFKALAARAALGEPLAYLTGWQAFYGLELAVDARVLIPRPDTETLVDWALELMDQAAVLGQRSSSGALSRLGSGAVLDLGTGSGAVALALKHSRPQWRVWASDASGDALAVAQSNAVRLGLDVVFSQGNWFEACLGATFETSFDATSVATSEKSGRFNLIVSNPPYIADNDAHLSALAHEPQQALTSGADGLDDIRHIVVGAPKHLVNGGWLLLEHGYDQAERVRALLVTHGFAQVQSRRDLNGIERCSGGVTVEPLHRAPAGTQRPEV